MQAVNFNGNEKLWCLNEDFFFNDGIFEIIPRLIAILFIAFFGTIIFRIIQCSIQWNGNNNSPLLTVNVKVVEKRILVDRHIHNNHDNYIDYALSSTKYYAVFEVESWL